MREAALHLVDESCVAERQAGLGGVAQLGTDSIVVVVGCQIIRFAGEAEFAPQPGVEQGIGVETVDVRAGAGPNVVFGAFGQAGADGVEVDVGQRREQVRGAEGAGEEAVLPQVSAGAVQAVEALGVDAVGASQGLGERVGALGDGDEMNVIGQQTVAEQGDAVDGAFAAQGVEVEAAVVVAEEDVLAVVAALGDVQLVTVARSV